MPIEFPNLYQTRFESISFCFWIPSTNERVVKLAQEQESTATDSSFGEEDNRCHVQLILGQFSDGDVHFHINIARESYFDGLEPEDDVPIDKIFELASEFCDCETSTLKIRAITAQRPIDDLPASGWIAQLVGIPTTVSGRRLEMIGSSMAVSGEFFDRVSWRKEDDSFSVRILATLRSAVINEYCLGGFVDRLEQGFKSLVLQEDESNAT